MFGGVERLEDGGNRIHSRREAALDSLNHRELAVPQEMALDASDTEIARRVSLSKQAVTRCAACILEKLGLPDRAAAVRLAREKGLRAV